MKYNSKLERTESTRISLLSLENIKPSKKRYDMKYNSKLERTELTRISLLSLENIKPSKKRFSCLTDPKGVVSPAVPVELSWFDR